MSTKRRRRVRKKSGVTGFQRGVLRICNPLGHIETGMRTPKFSSYDHARQCWCEVRNELIAECWTEPNPGAQELWIDRSGMPPSFWIFDATDIAAERLDGEGDRELLKRFGITGAQDAIGYPSRRSQIAADDG